MTDSIDSTWFGNNLAIREGYRVAKRTLDTYEDKAGLRLLDVETYYIYEGDGLESDDNPEEMAIVTLHVMDGEGGFVGDKEVRILNNFYAANVLRDEWTKQHELMHSRGFNRCSECGTRFHNSDFALIYGEALKKIWLCVTCHNEASQEV